MPLASICCNNSPLAPATFCLFVTWPLLFITFLPCSVPGIMKAVASSVSLAVFLLLVASTHSVSPSSPISAVAVLSRDLWV